MLDDICDLVEELEDIEGHIRNYNEKKKRKEKEVVEEVKGVVKKEKKEDPEEKRERNRQAQINYRAHNRNKEDDFNKYSNGKIYKLLYGNQMIYIGSTVVPLQMRLNVHKSAARGDHHRSEVYKFLKDKELDELTIELIEDYPCEDEMELQMREGEVIKENFDRILNTVIPGRTGKQYYEDNKEKILNKFRETYSKERAKEYYENNKEKAKEYYLKNKEKQKEYQKKYKEKNKEKFEAYKEKQKEARKAIREQKLKEKEESVLKLKEEKRRKKELRQEERKKKDRDRKRKQSATPP
jgi:hypothetical protein